LRMMMFGNNRQNEIMVSSYWFALIREHNSERSMGDNNPVKLPENRAKISAAKTGKKRNDMKGKRYFGADEDKIRMGIEKIRQKKIGRKINYPKNRNSPPCTPEKAKKISESKVAIDQRFIEMTDAEFEKWISDKNLYRKDGRPNPNITRVLKLRNIPKERYYK